MPVPAGDGAELREAARRAASRLRAGEILVHPTSTLYGLGAAALPGLDAELRRLKGREEDEGGAFIRLAPHPEAVRRRIPLEAWDDRAERLSGVFWPGSLTLVLDDGSALGLAVRVDGHPVVLEVLREAGGLMSSTSVNRSGQPPARGPAEVRRALEGLPEARARVTFLNAGELPGGEPSTILSLRERPPRLLRAGAVPVERIEECLGEEVAD